MKKREMLFMWDVFTDIFIKKTKLTDNQNDARYILLNKYLYLLKLSFSIGLCVCNY